MDPQLISKILRFSDPESSAIIDAQHPLLDPASCRALSAGLVRLLRVSAAAPRARNALLSNIRALTAHAHSHHQSTQSLLNILTEYYAKLPTKQHQHICDAFEEQISSFLSSQLENIILENKVDKSTISLVRALLNVNPENPYIEVVTRRFLAYNESDKLVNRFLQEVWVNNIFTCKELVDKLSIRAKPEIERILLNASCNIISTEIDVSEILSSKPIKNLLDKSANSRICFQTVCRVLNSIFIRSNFHSKINTFIQLFTENVKLSSNLITLYHDDVQCLMMMLSCDEVMEAESAAANVILMQLRELRTKSEEQFIMLISHCPQWFDYIVERNIDLK